MRWASGEKARKLVDQRVGRGFELVVRHAFGGDAPVVGLLRRNAPRAHHDVLGAGDADDLLQARRAAGAGDLAEPLLGQRVEAGLRDDAEVAGERNLEADAEAEAAVGGDHRLRAARRRGDVPGELGDGLGRRLHEALDVAAADEKCSPIARSTMTRTRASSSSCSNTRRSWSRCGIDTTLSGGRSRMTSARSRASSISTRKPSSAGEAGVVEDGG